MFKLLTISPEFNQKKWLKFFLLNYLNPGQAPFYKRLVAPDIALTLTVVLLLTFCGTAKGGIIEGVVFSDNGPIISSRVFAYPDYQSLVVNKNFIKSDPGEKAGQYRIELPPGSYYLTATGELDGQQLFSYHGINPIITTDDYRWLPFFLARKNDPICKKGPEQGIKGVVSYQGSPLDHGVISVYKSQNGKFRGMGLLTNTIDGNGVFFFNLESGSYVLIARQKKDESGIGPVMQGDLFCYPSANPVTVEKDQLCELAIECYPRDNLTGYLDRDGVNPQGRRHESRRSASLWNIQPEDAQTELLKKPITISGRVTDLTDKPLANLVVTAYPAQGIDLFQMHILRLITENRARTDSDGYYQIQLSAGGLYYLQARQKIGDAPDRLEYYGLYEGNPNHSIKINPGETRNNIDIQVSNIMPVSDLKERLRQVIRP